MTIRSLLSGFTLLCALLATAPVLAQKVYLAHDGDKPQAAYAARKLGEALTE